MGKHQGVPKPAFDVSLARLPSINYQVSDNRGTIRLPPNQAIVGHLTYVSIVSLDAALSRRVQRVPGGTKDDARGTYTVSITAN